MLTEKEEERGICLFTLTHQFKTCLPTYGIFRLKFTAISPVPRRVLSTE